jgi:hypothetical protein
MKRPGHDRKGRRLSLFIFLITRLLSISYVYKKKATPKTQKSAWITGKSLPDSSRDLTYLFWGRRKLLERLGQELRLGDSVGSKD